MTGEHVVPLRIYYAVFTVLLAMTAATVAISFFDLGPMNTVAALGIAGFKATLVILYFMHVRWSGRLVWLAVAAGLFWLGILLVLTLADVATRGWL